VAEPDVRAPAAAILSAKSTQEDEYIPLAVIAGRMKKFSENISTIPEVMNSSTVNFNTNFNYSRFFLAAGPIPFRCVLVSLDQSLAYVKISGRSTP